MLERRLAETSAIDPDWALYGPFGVALDATHVGPVWSSSLGAIVGRVPLAPTKVQSYDELMIILRRSSDLRFDETLPGWHLYGTDIVTFARSQGLYAYAGALPTLHNDAYHEALRSDFGDRSPRTMRAKWCGPPARPQPDSKDLPLWPAPVEATLERHHFPRLPRQHGHWHRARPCTARCAVRLVRSNCVALTPAVASDLHGQSARAMVKAIIAGQPHHAVLKLASAAA